jgi:hypothetical protein
VAFLVFTFAFKRSRIVLPGFAAIIICLSTSAAILLTPPAPSLSL